VGGRLDTVAKRLLGRCTDHRRRLLSRSLRTQRQAGTPRPAGGRSHRLRPGAADGRRPAPRDARPRRAGANDLRWYDRRADRRRPEGAGQL
ncbi:MAG: hypothetical protein AVDCRST_MAG44-1502, partial [uncultured Sphingomonas sp.]